MKFLVTFSIIEIEFRFQLAVSDDDPLLVKRNKLRPIRAYDHLREEASVKYEPSLRSSRARYTRHTRGIALQATKRYAHLSVIAFPQPAHSC